MRWLLRIVGNMPCPVPDNGSDSYYRLADLKFPPVYGQEIELRKRGGLNGQEPEHSVICKQVLCTPTDDIG